MKKIIVLAALLSSTIGALNAQVSVGVRAGANFASWEYEPKRISTPTYVINEPSTQGLALSMLVEFRLAEELAILVEPSFLQKGYSFTETYTAPVSATVASFQSSSSTVLNYLELPIIFKPIVMYSDKLQLGLLVGPSLGFALGGQRKADYRSSGLIQSKAEDIDFSKEAYKNFSRLDITLVGGVQPTYVLSDNGRLFLDVRYQLGLANLNTERNTATKIFNRGFGLSLGYLHTLGRK